MTEEYCGDCPVYEKCRFYADRRVNCRINGDEVTSLSVYDKLERNANVVTDFIIEVLHRFFYGGGGLENDI